MNGELGVPLDNAHQFANFLPYVLSLPVPERPRRVARSFPHLEVVNSWFCIETDLPVIREGSPILSRRQEAREHEKKILGLFGDELTPILLTWRIRWDLHNQGGIAFSRDRLDDARGSVMHSANKAVRVERYLKYLDKEMTIMGILSGFCVTVLALGIKLWSGTDSPRVDHVVRAAPISLVLGALMLLLAALAFYRQRSLLA
jgi:hypothetical protein